MIKRRSVFQFKRTENTMTQKYFLYIRINILTNTLKYIILLVIYYLKEKLISAKL